MLKRLSGTFSGGGSSPSDPAFLVAPAYPAPARPGSLSPRTSPRWLPSSSSPDPRSALQPPSPGGTGAYPFPVVQQQQQQQHPWSADTPGPPPPAGIIDRSTLHKSLAALSALLVALDELRDLKLAHAKAERKVAKALRELAIGFTTNGAGKSPVVVEALAAAGAMLDARGQLDVKHAKRVQKEYEALNDSVAKFFKRTAKEEKSYEDTISSLDARVAKATAAYQQSAASSASTRNMHAHLDSLTSVHSGYMSTLGTLSAQIKSTKLAYGQAIAARREAIAREVGKVACGLAEGEWLASIEAVKAGGGQALGRTVTAGKWCEAGLESAADWFEPPPPEAVEHTEVEHGVTTTAAQGPRSEDLSGRSGTLRGPRAPSTSTTQTATTTSSMTTSTNTSGSAHSSQPSSSSAPSLAPYPPPLTGGRSPEPSSPAAPREPSRTPRPPTSPSQYPSSPHPDGRDTLRTDTFRNPDVAPTTARDLPSGWAQGGTRPQQDAASLSRSQAVEGVLRRPTPKWGTAPPRAEAGIRDHEPVADEFGRMSNDRQDNERQRVGDNNLQRQDSFVARMSAKYAHTEQHDAPDRGPTESSSSATVPRTNAPVHARSSSRVSVLAKRYSSPPDATFSSVPHSAGPGSGEGIRAPEYAVPAAHSQGRPAPPPRGWTDAPRASAPYPTSGGSRSPSRSPPRVPPPRESEERQAVHWSTSRPELPPLPPPPTQRRHAYESASPSSPTNAPQRPLSMGDGYVSTLKGLDLTLKADSAPRSAWEEGHDWIGEDVEARWRAAT